MKNLSQYLIEASKNLPSVNLKNDTIEINADPFCHLMYGVSYDELEESEIDEEEAKSEITTSMKEFAKGTDFKKINIQVKYKTGDYIEISGITTQNFWDYIDCLKTLPGDIYFDDILQFLPESDVDEDDLYDFVKNWCEY